MSQTFPTKTLKILFVLLIASALGGLIFRDATRLNAEDTEHRKMRLPPPTAAEIAALPPDGGAEFNRLVFEKSPYLLQHARNPVDWRPWGDEAFEKARAEDKPVFLSVGYSTCHWCHVMEHESFEDAEVAQLLNDLFVPVKVDREERPDIDNVYMTVTQAMTGSGGWPMTVIMTPDKRPFFAGTYFPRTGRHGRAGMMELLPAISTAWKTKRDEVIKQSDEISRALKHQSRGVPGAEPGEEILRQAYESFASRFDSEHGGFGDAPKFPVPHNLSFLLRYWYRSGNQSALDMVEKTLHEMRAGGIYDHVGYGFHRYSTDAVWLLPHFEKMLYDQALMAIAYIETHQATGKPFYADVAREIFTYVLRDMTSDEGGFYCAEDADSEGEEGKFYVWSSSEVRSILGASDGDLFTSVYNFKSGGNFVDQATRRKTGDNIPHLQASLEDIANTRKVNPDALTAQLEESRKELFSVREKRIHPLKDDKILTDWNGLMIAAFAKGARALQDPNYAAAAKGAADFVLARLRRDDGRLLKRYRDGEAGLPAHLEDYAFFVWGLLELYETTFEESYLKHAISLNNLMLRHFWDDKDGGFFLTADDGEQLLVRSKEIYDGAIPSGNSVAALNLIRLARLTGDTGLEERCGALMRAFSGNVTRYPPGHSQFLIAVDFQVGPSYEVVLVGDRTAVTGGEMLTKMNRTFIPNKVVLYRDTGDTESAMSDIAGFTRTMTALATGPTTAYVCRNFACELPTTDSAAVMRSLQSAR